VADSCNYTKTQQKQSFSEVKYISIDCFTYEDTTFNGCMAMFQYALQTYLQSNRNKTFVMSNGTQAKHMLYDCSHASAK
jgi:hypothetical protein